MRITFLLPGPGRDPVGGFKIAYEYANRLTARGHAVTVVHASRAEKGLSLPTALRRAGVYALRRMAGAYGPSPWFALDPGVRSVWAPSLSPSHVPDGDAVVATAWQTAEWAAAYPESKGKKFYLIQSIRRPGPAPEDRVMATWKLPMTKVVISRSLEQVALSGANRAFTFRMASTSMSSD